MRFRAPFLLLCLAASLTVLLAGAELVLEDGQVLEAANVKRDGEVYIIELKSGGLLTIPVDLIKKVRVTGDDVPRLVAGEAPPPGPSGIRHGEPVTVAGEPVRPPRTSEQVEALGQPAEFRDSIIDPTWHPESAFDPNKDVLAGSRSTFQESVIDPTWQPESAFDANEDVLADSRSTFRKSVIDPTWHPTDGFSKRKTSWGAQAATGKAGRVMTASRTVRPVTEYGEGSLTARPWHEAFAASVSSPGVRFQFPVSLRRTETTTTRRIDPRTCAEEILGGSDLRVELLKGERYAILPIPIYVAESDIDEKTRRAAFATTGGVCRLITGEPRELLGLNLTPEHAVARAATAYNAALGDATATRLETARSKQAYAFAVSSVIHLHVVSPEKVDLVLLSDAADIEEIDEHRRAGCPVSSGKHRKAARTAARAITPPQVDEGTTGEVVEFLTWSNLGGAVVRHAVHLSENGKVAVHRETLAEHLGDHLEPADD
jgi:hypothetical protein